MKNQLPWALCLIVLFMLSCKAETTTEKADDTTVKVDSTAEISPVEFADPKYTDIVKATLNSLSSGDVAGMLSNYADNAVYAWNSGDSLAGKAAISEYWTKRRGEVIETLTYGDQIFLPVKVNTPQSSEAPGIWVLAWHETSAKYKATGKSMTQWIHSDVHFDANDKIDRWIQYSDRALINAALTK